MEESDNEVDKYYQCQQHT